MEENRSKFNVGRDIAKRTCDGITFDSILEMRYYRDVLKPAIESGDVVGYELQKPYELQPGFTHDGQNVRPVTYVADFVIEYADKSVKVIDTKGLPDAVALLKRKLFWFKYPNIDYEWITYSKKFGGWMSYDKYKYLSREEKRRIKKENGGK